MYQFARCQTHPKFLDLQGWYLILEPDDVDTLMDLHQGVAKMYFHKFWMDPHLSEYDKAGMCNPVKLATSWMQSVMKLLSAGPVMVNSSGGMLPPGGKVLSTIESKTMSWPVIYEDEIITVCRWPEGRHFYLSSNKNRIFVPSKYHEYEAALHAARQYTDNIKEKC